MCLSVLLFADFALKLILNAITTGANIIKGRVYGNTMINLTVANSKVCVVMRCVLHGVCLRMASMVVLARCWLNVFFMLLYCMCQHVWFHFGTCALLLRTDCCLVWLVT